MVAPKKQKKAMESINSRLALVMKSGKYCLGYKQTLKVHFNCVLIHENSFDKLGYSSSLASLVEAFFNIP